MKNEDRAMRWCQVVFVALIAAGCTKPNPRSCSDGTCTDPAFPFCDVDGALEGHPQTCIAVSCTAGEVAACRGDVALTCNTEGTDYNEVQCAKGCDVAIGGCRVCDANQTVCANGVVQSCDANGLVTSSETCALGCFENEPRCREPVFSNDMNSYLDMVPMPPDLDLSAGGVIDTSTREITSASGSVQVPTFVVPATGLAPQVMVVVVNTAKLGSVQIKNDDPIHGGAAIAIVAKHDMSVLGKLIVRSGDIVDGPCVGGRAQVHFDAGTQADSSSGSGGGGHATAGARGGSTPTQAATTGGQAAGTPTLIPLRGGCASGGTDENGVPQTNVGARGGGAIQLSSRTKIAIEGQIDANGNPAFDQQTMNSGASVGGGAGGGILIEAPLVDIGPSGALLAQGTDGSGCDPGAQVCSSGNTSFGGPGRKATNTAAATAGGNSTTMIGGGGGGGAGLGRLRVNTSDGTYQQSSTSILVGVVTTSALPTK